MDFHAVVLPAAVMVALAVDRLWGEPPARLHPVVWMGRALGWAGERIAPRPAVAPAGFDARAWGLGLCAWWGLALLCVAVAWALQEASGAGGALVARVAEGLGLAPHHGAWVSALLQALALGVLLKPLLAHRMLVDEVRAVEAALQRSLPEGRARLAWLVSRDVSALTPEQVRESAIESLAENLNDSVVAPLFWFVLGGLPAAAVFRLANTADAMWGYPGERGGRVWTWAGQWAARADDVLGWVPARLTALLLWPVVLNPGGGFAHARRLWAEARRTPSPNSGWPMAAMALRLGVRLGKPGVYTLNAPAAAPMASQVQQAVDVAKKMTLALFMFALAAMFLGVMVVD
ncbi:adenosylcobinamide-phosphate synthase CbiB [Hydrogenophaga soli]